jgi:hypothetical protein
MFPFAWHKIDIRKVQEKFPFGWHKIDIRKAQGKVSLRMAYN